MVKKYLVGTLVCLGMSPMLIAEEGSDQFYTPSAVVSEPLDPCCINPVYPLPGNISPNCGWDVYVSGEFIYFSASKDTFPGSVFQVAFDDSEILLLVDNTHYRPGFRISCGVDLGSVVFDATYLRYHSHNTTHNHAAPNSGLAYSYPEPNFLTRLVTQAWPLFQTVKATTGLAIDTAVFSLQRPVYMGKRLLMNLNYGIRATWTKQTADFTATALAAVPVLPPNPFPVLPGTSDGKTKILHSAWGVGANLGFSATALLPCHFQLLSKLNLALQYAENNKISISASYPDLPVFLAPPFLGNNTIKEGGKGPHVEVWHEGEIGIGWGEYLCCDRYHVNFSVSYNWILNHMLVYFGSTSIFGSDFSSIGNFSVHGISVGGRLDF